MMTVKELIEKLSKENPDAIVLKVNWDDYDTIDDIEATRLWQYGYTVFKEPTKSYPANLDVVILT
jgi:hypothetical protein